MKQITREEIKKLERNKIIRNSTRGYIDFNNNYPTGFYRTKNSRYIEDKYVDIASKI